MRRRIRSMIASWVCRRRGHAPRTIRSFDEALALTLTSCRRCEVPLDFEERRGRYPLPAERVSVTQ